jgi:hypothetical protein
MDMISEKNEERDEDERNVQHTAYSRSISFFFFRYASSYPNFQCFRRLHLPFCRHHPATMLNPPSRPDHPPLPLTNAMHPESPDSSPGYGPRRRSLALCEGRMRSHVSMSGKPERESRLCEEMEKGSVTGGGGSGDGELIFLVL